MKIRYFLSAVVALIGISLSVPLALIAALPVFITVDSNGRQQIHRLWRWLTTHDAPIDSYFFDGYFSRGKILSKYTREEIYASAWLMYIGRVTWIWRNPAYQLEHWLGYDQKGVTPSPDRFKDERWDTGVENKAYWEVVNSRNQRAFLYQKQVHWGYNFKNWWSMLPNWRFTLELQFGWKLYRRDPDQRCMLALRFSPFKQY